jgi:glycosyltransferase involved in cell wall biosynthesis
MFGAHHAEWALAHGVAAWYAPSPIVDLGGRDWERRRAETTRSSVPRILMIGHLRGIATISGLQVFAESILPVLTRELGPDGFEVHVVGGYDPPAAAGNAFAHPAVLRRGQIEPPDDEFLAADVLLVPTPLTTGPRSRIITGMTFGSCVVAHEANRLGIPELVDGENAILAADGPALAEATLAALADPEARARVGRAARQLYETTFTPSIAGARIVQELERVADEARRPAVAVP